MQSTILSHNTLENKNKKKTEEKLPRKWKWFFNRQICYVCWILIFTMFFFFCLFVFKKYIVENLSEIYFYMEMKRCILLFLFFFNFLLTMLYSNFTIKWIECFFGGKKIFIFVYVHCIFFVLTVFFFYLKTHTLTHVYPLWMFLQMLCSHVLYFFCLYQPHVKKLLIWFVWNRDFWASGAYLLMFIIKQFWGLRTFKIGKKNRMEIARE